MSNCGRCLAISEPTVLFPFLSPLLAVFGPTSMEPHRVSCSFLSTSRAAELTISPAGEYASPIIPNEHASSTGFFFYQFANSISCYRLYSSFLFLWLESFEAETSRIVCSSKVAREFLVCVSSSCKCVCTAVVASQRRWLIIY